MYGNIDQKLKDNKIRTSMQWGRDMSQSNSWGSSSEKKTSAPV